MSQSLTYRNILFQWNLLVYIVHSSGISKSLTHRKYTFPVNLIVSNDSNGLHRNNFQPPLQREWKFFKVSHEWKIYFSDGIYSCPMDPMDSIGTTFNPLYNKSRNFSKSLTNRKFTFPMESIRVRWIRWTPSERLSTPSYNMRGNFSKSLTNRKYTFPTESIRVRWIRWTPSERLSTPSTTRVEIFLSLSPTENLLFRWNLFVSDGSDGLHRNDFQLPRTRWEGIFLSLSRIENILFRRNLFVSDGSDGLHRNDFQPPRTTWEGIFLSLLRIENILFRWNLFVSDGSPTLNRTFHH